MVTIVLFVGGLAAVGVTLVLLFVSSFTALNPYWTAAIGFGIAFIIFALNIIITGIINHNPEPEKPDEEALEEAKRDYENDPVVKYHLR